MTQFRIATESGTIDKTADDLVIIDGADGGYFTFILTGCPVLMVKASDVIAVERIEAGEWAGVSFRDMISADYSV